MGKQDSLITSISLGKNKRDSVRALGKERVESRVQWRSKTQCVCISIHNTVPVLFYLVIVLCLCECVCAEEGSEEKINKEGTFTSNSSLGSLSMHVCL